MGKTILIVEDEKTIVDILCFNLKKEGYDTIEAYDGESGLFFGRTKNPDLILLDVMLPKLNGFDVCKSLRDEGVKAPIIMLTAREEESDKVSGLELGADDYITKPFSMRELIARVNANIRRGGMDPRDKEPLDPDVIYAGALEINTTSYLVSKNGNPVELTQKEYELLKFLAARPDTVFTREELMEKVWNYDYFGDMRTVDVTVRRLREKVEDNPGNPAYIITRRGVGYLFQMPD